MPGFITHLLFGKQSLSFIESAEAKTLLEKHPTCFGLGLQGPDIFFYHIPAYLFYKKNIGNVMHSNNVMLFFDNLFDARNSFENQTDRSICDAYIIGFIGHYSLDITCHPYIYYKSDHFNNLKKVGKYDFGRHVSLETDIDHMVLSHYLNLLPNQFDYGDAVEPSSEEKVIITNLLFLAINKTFPEYKLKRKTINGAISSFVNLNRKMHDPTGKKKRRIRKIEQLLFKCAFISSMIPSDTIIKYHDPCNENHSKWHNPWYPSIERIESIFDLINQTMPEYINKIDLYIKAIDINPIEDNDSDSVDETNTYLHYRNKLLAELSDLSYLSGLPLT